MESLVITGMKHRQHSRGRLKEEMSEAIAQQGDEANVSEMLRASKELKMWRTMITSAIKLGT